MLDGNTKGIIQFNCVIELKSWGKFQYCFKLQLVFSFPYLSVFTLKMILICKIYINKTV